MAMMHPPEPPMLSGYQLTQAGQTKQVVRSMDDMLPHAGTGGHMNLALLALRQGTGYSPVTIKVRHDKESAQSSVQTTVADQIALIRKAIKPSMGDLAKAFGVTRQTLYNWANGAKQPGSSHLTQLDDLSNAAQKLVEAGITGSLIGRRKISNGRNLLELVQNGEDATETADRLIAMLNKETKQHARIASRLTDPKRTTPTEVPGTPMLDE